MTNYKFQTIVATSQVRAEFSVMRDIMKSSDKELMAAMFELARKHPGDLEQIVQGMQAEARGYTDRAKELKAAAKVRAKEMVKEILKKEMGDVEEAPAVVVKKARRTKAKPPTEELEVSE